MIVIRTMWRDSRQHRDISLFWCGQDNRDAWGPLADAAQFFTERQAINAWHSYGDGYRNAQFLQLVDELPPPVIPIPSRDQLTILNDAIRTNARGFTLASSIPLTWNEIPEDPEDEARRILTYGGMILEEEQPF